MKKSLCVALSLIMILSLMGGCSKQPAATTAAPTEAATTAAPTEAATTAAPTEAATTAAPTEAPTTAAPTEAPTTAAPTEAPTTAAPTEAPTTAAPTEAPTTAAPTEAPTTVAPTEPVETEAPVPEEGSAARAYGEAANNLPENYKLSLNWELSRSMGKEMLIVTDSREILVQDAGSDDMRAHEIWDRNIEGNLFQEELSYEFWYARKGTLLLRNGEYYEGKQEAEDFLAARPPLAMLTPEKYDSVEWVESSAQVIRFSEPNDTEWEWLGMDCSDITDAWGTVELDEEGRILRTVYDAVFALEGISFAVHVTAELEELDEEIGLPQVESRQIRSFGNTDAVPLMDLASFAFQTDGMSADYLAFVQSYAAGAVVLQQAWMDLDENENGPMVYYRLSRGTYSITNRFSGSEYRHFNGTTSYEEDDEETEPSFTPEEAETQILDFLSLYWLVPEELENLLMTEEEDCWLLEFDVNAAGKQTVFYNTEVLVEEEEEVDISSYKSQKCWGYLSIDKSSGLPIHLVVHLEGTQKASGRSVPVYAEYELNFMGADPDAASTIMDEVQKGSEPEELPTPLFYEVTAPEGGKMWLIGTIHVGDNRTSWLPQEIYDALLSSDALAVEIDTSNLEERLDEDEDLLEAYQESTYYFDGSTAYDHLSDEQAEKLEKAIMKYGGDIMVNALSYNVATITSYLEQLTLPLGRLHSYDRGVDNQLVDMAKENGIPVWDVEDYAEHISLLGNFSEKLQALIMEETVDGGRYGSNLGAQKLFDLWCRGDEAEIEAAFEEEEEEDEDLSEEERALVEEYNQGMMVKRNAEMVEKAKEYMASDKVVFFAVGLGHLMGEDGLLNCLREAGYSVEQVEYK